MIDSCVFVVITYTNEEFSLRLASINLYFQSFSTFINSIVPISLLVVFPVTFAMWVLCVCFYHDLMQCDARKL